MTAILEVRDLKKIFGGVAALDGVDLHVDEREIVSVIGPNGAGKTSLFNVISGLFPPDGGTISFKGEDIAGLQPNQITERGLARTFQNVKLFPNLTVLENVMVGQHCRNKSGAWDAILQTPRFKREEKEIEEKAKDILSFFGTRLSGYRHNQPAFALSYANRRRLEIARCLVSDPSILLLDEPFAGIDPVTVQSIRGVIRQLRAKGISVLITDHAAREILGTVDRCYVIYQGEVLIDGTPAEVKSHPKVREEYLGDLDD